MLNPTRVLEKALYFTTQTLQKTVPYADNNTFLNGIYAPVTQEVTVFDLQVEGEIPTVLNGMLTRIGPNPMQVKNPAAYHWFLGDGMVHAVKLQAGRALWYRNRYIGVDSVQKTLKRPLLAGARHGIYDTVNTNVFGHAGKIYALVEAGACPVELDTELNSIKHGLFESPLNQGYTAHPHCDPQTGELHAICYDALALNVLRYVVIDPQGQVRRNLKIPVSGSPMVHDCAITQSSVIILDLPVGFSVQAAVKGGALPYCWRPKKTARVGLLPREGQADDIRWFEVDACFSFHIANAFDMDNGDTIIDLVVHEKMFDRSTNGPEADGSKVTLERWTLPARGKHVQRKVMSNTPQEFPRIDERLVGQPHRYVYSISMDSRLDSTTPNLLQRCDMQTGQIESHSYGHAKMTSEAVFVPKSDTSAEADGWLISYVHDLNGGDSQLVILDSQKLGQSPQAVIHLGAHVPMGFHASWIADVV